MDSLGNNSILYLYNVGNLFESPILKSCNLIKCYTHAEEENVNLPAKFRDVLTRCPKCLNDRNQNNTTYRTKAEVKDRFSSKLSRKKSLTKFQWKYLKKSGAGNHNAMVISCRICGHTVVKKMKKPEKPVKIVPKKPEQHVKKKKRKDKYAGLNVTVVTHGSRENVQEIKMKSVNKSMLQQDKKNAKKYKSKLGDMLSAKTKTSKCLKAFLQSI